MSNYEAYTNDSEITLLRNELVQLLNENVEKEAIFEDEETEDFVLKLGGDVEANDGVWPIMVTEYLNDVEEDSYFEINVEKYLFRVYKDRADNLSDEKPMDDEEIGILRQCLKRAVWLHYGPTFVPELSQYYLREEISF